MSCECVYLILKLWYIFGRGSTNKEKVDILVIVYAYLLVCTAPCDFLLSTLAAKESSLEHTSFGKFSFHFFWSFFFFKSGNPQFHYTCEFLPPRWGLQAFSDTERTKQKLKISFAKRSEYNEEETKIKRANSELTEKFPCIYAGSLQVFSNEVRQAGKLCRRNKHYCFKEPWRKPLMNMNCDSSNMC